MFSGQLSHIIFIGLRLNNAIMKIILAPDKFKGSLTGIEFCSAVEQGIKEVVPQVNIVKLPLADGGDGTIEILNYHLQGEVVKTIVNNPLFKKVEASYLFIKATHTAFIEMAEASGMKLLTPEEQNCMHTTTFGTGELIFNAIKKGAKTIVLGIGGSATNDCGIGMANALGFKFLNEKNIEIIPIGKNVSKIKKIDTSEVLADLKNIEFKVACDVTNPLYGVNGAAHVYGPQKGASPDEVKELDKGLEHISKLFFNQFNIDVQKIDGAGAAGGMGAGAKVFLNSSLLSGVEMVKEMIGFEVMVKDADCIITGEGKLDDTSFSGKTLSGIISSATHYNIPVVCLCGSIGVSKTTLKDRGVFYAYSILEEAASIDDAMVNSAAYLSHIAADFARKYLTSGSGKLSKLNTPSI